MRDVQGSTYRSAISFCRENRALRDRLDAKLNDDALSLDRETPYAWNDR